MDHFLNPTKIVIEEVIVDQIHKVIDDRQLGFKLCKNDLKSFFKIPLNRW